ncbi:SUMF1/EgtB/PvdO family nonheme iron enzyme [Treponema sp. UBA6852]|uniref:SUMF1/EgtB/PvdO family nonheme iron enzyme n=1 Tax=Treponema sp. UBA6852 TaxID=1947744 RepID=UPI0025D407B8|nr:SUMF1/EgtB/PvdO family nonheme iron enzyme [Treponema sp. UBA6852]
MKKTILLVSAILLAGFIYAQNIENGVAVQVLTPETVNLPAGDAAWLPGQIQDKVKSNVQDYLELKTVVDSKAEAAVKKLQAEAEGSARDESTAIELGKLTTAKYALFTKIRKTASGYVVSADFTDLTTGVQKASATSKEYTQASSLYGSTGAVDEITLALAGKLGIKISDLNKNLLSTGSSSFSVDEQLELAKQNEAQFQKMMNEYDAELSKLMTSNDINAIQNKNRIEAEKALLKEKQNAEKKRQEELKAQKARADADSKLEAERSIALKTQRDKLAKDAAAKAAEVRKLKTEKQGVLGLISMLESKKKALVEIRQGVEARSVELHTQMKEDETEQTLKILEANWASVEMKDGKPTEAAKQRRANKVLSNNDALLAKFLADCESVKQSTMAQQNALLQSINADYKKLAAVKTVSSMGGELKVGYGTYDGDKCGWNAYLSLYSDGILLFQDTFIVKYETLAGKAAPDMATASDAQLEEYINNTDMYTSLLVRGDPILYFELDYNAIAAAKDKPSTYTFYFTKLRAINTVSGKVVQTSTLNEELVREMKPVQDLREIQGVVAEEKAIDKIVKDLRSQGKGIEQAEKLADDKSFFERYYFAEDSKKRSGIDFAVIPGQDFVMSKTEITQAVYKAVMGKNPSRFTGDSLPVENVSWYDAVEFCNRLSKKAGLKPAYSINGKDVEWNDDADGYSLPTVDEWQYAARGGENYKYSGSDNLDEVGWYDGNSGYKTHPVAQKKPNGYGLYDMSGNVWEWCWDSYRISFRYYCGCGWYSDANNCEVGDRDYYDAYLRYNDLGFRIVRSIGK